jgi:pyruvate dehydrogenase kinase 2/3/4
MRATVEYHGIDADYPPIKVVIADGSDNEDVIIKVSDEGGGIPRSNMKRIWSYVSTSAQFDLGHNAVFTPPCGGEFTYSPVQCAPPLTLSFPSAHGVP